MKKTPDGVVLSCIRDDGSVAVQRTRYGGFFAFHDLMHYSVETVMGYDRAFLGLVAAGWDFETFTDKQDPRYQSLPAQALLAERLVGALSRLHGDAVLDEPDLLQVLVDEVNQEIAPRSALSEPPPLVTAARLSAIYRRFRELASRWVEVSIGEHLQLPFPIPEPTP